MGSGIDSHKVSASLREENVYAAERRLCGIRLLAVLSGFFLFPPLAHHTPAVHRTLAYALMALGSVYAGTLYLAEPYRRYALLRSGAFLAVGDALFINLWTYASGGFYSPFFVILYGAMVSLAFRFSARVSLFGALLYVASYLGMVLALGQLPGHGGIVAVRVTFILLTALVGTEVSRELYQRGTERARAAELLAQAGASLASSLDYAATLNQVAQLAVPELADLCIVDLVEPDGSLRRVAVCSAEPRLAALVPVLKERFAPTWESPQSTVRVIKSGEPELLSEIDATDREEHAVSAEHAAIMRTFAARSKITVPMIARGRTLGAMILALSSLKRRYRASELALAEELARLAALAVDNARLYREAQEATEMRDVFLSVASHELKTPLTSLQLQVQTLLRMAAHSQDGTLPRDRVAAKAVVLERQVERLTMLVNRLLDSTRLTRGVPELDRTEVDLGNLAEEVVERFREVLLSKGTEAIVNRPEKVLGSWDRLRLDQALSNLVANAIKYGAGHPIEIDITKVEGVARLTVRDHGIGIAKADQARIFGRFERAVSSKTYAGIGMGLWIARQIAEAHGGRIEVSSQPGEGATFLIELPCA